jgi:hypothetical protein
MDNQIKNEFTCSVLDIFKNKAIVALVAEKALNNCKAKINSGWGIFYYFTVWHSFKQIDQKQLFKIDEKTDRWTDYLSLDFEHVKSVANDLEKLTGHLQNLNGHYLHSFDCIKENEISPGIIRFLKETFRLAAVQSFINEKISTLANKQAGAPLTKEQKKEIVSRCLEDESQIVHFLKTLFCQEDKYKTGFADSSCTTLNQMLNFILFVETEKNVDWELNPGDHKHVLLTITKGKYLSFNAILFLLSLFLYKNEASTLIPRIPGFKRNGPPEDQRKLNIFLFYAQKFTLQDMSREDKHLLFFHDIMQYTGKFPLAWNKVLEGEETPTVANFKHAINRREIEKQFPDLCDNPGFKNFAFEYFFEGKHKNEKHIFRDLIEKDGDIIKVYWDITARNLNTRNYTDIRNYHYFIAQYLIDTFYADERDLKDCCNAEIPGNLYVRYKKIFNKKDTLNKFNRRIAHNLIIQSYARNQDRFLEFGIRYLAENNYFGENTQFKVYKYYYSIEQQEIYGKLDGKTKDKLKFKDGKEVTYRTYTENRKWNTPFLIENNAVFIKLEDEERSIAIQRDLMIYFLEDALFAETAGNRGLKILKEYSTELDGEKTDALDVLKRQNTIVKEEKTGFKKILPRRLLNNYLAADQNSPNRGNGLWHILKHAETQETRYEQLREKAISQDKRQKEHPIETNTEELGKALFDDRNKGKNFKLVFIRKACHIMYFKDIYRQKSELEGHHKRFHITRDEYRDFCKWMYAFDTSAYYKTRLTALFKQKGFFENAEFRAIIEDSSDLNEIYEKVKQKYRDCLTQNEKTAKKGKCDLDSYNELLNKGVRYINVWHFKQFLEKKGYLKKENGKFIYPSLENREYLFPEYYIEKPTDKMQMKLWNDLQKTRHEDCLLYEMAMRYFNEDNAAVKHPKSVVQTILSAGLEFTQKYRKFGETKIYTVSVPLNDVDKWIEIQESDKTQKLPERLPVYLLKNKYSKELRSIAQRFEAQGNREIALTDFSKVNSHLINSQAKFTGCVMALEEFYIWKGKLTMPDGKNRLTVFDIKELAKYPFLNRLHDAAFRFSLPVNKTYREIFAEVEKTFALEMNENETGDTLPRMHKKVLEVFLGKMRNDLYDKSIRFNGGQISIKEIWKNTMKAYIEELKRKKEY